jgi:3-oxoacyl-[acyl-carrier-protein] synthase II
VHQADRGIRNQGKRRVVVTGIGAITPIGIGVEGLWTGVMRAESAVRTITRFDPSHFNSHIAAEVDGFDPADYLEPRAVRRLDRCSQFAVSASKMAVADSGLELENEDPSQIGVCIGSALGGASFAEEQHSLYYQHGPRAVAAALALQVFVGAGSCNTAIEMGLTGYSTSNADSCASGPIAIGNALRAIQRGDADVMLAGGSEATLSPLCFGAFALIRALSTRNADPSRACRPFDRDRDGFVMGEGAAVLVLEEWNHARNRGARPYAEVVGFSLTNDGHHMTAPRPDAESAARAISLSLDDACLPPESIDYVNAHGSSTPLNDSTETLAIKKALGNHAFQTPVSSTKSLHAHPLGATGAIEAAICCLALQRGCIPATANLENPDPSCDLDYVPLEPRAARLRHVLSNSFGFGGINACLVISAV